MGFGVRFLVFVFIDILWIINYNVSNYYYNMIIVEYFFLVFLNCTYVREID